MGLIKSFWCFIVLTMIYSPHALSVAGTSTYGDTTETMSNAKYIGGGVVSIIPGFGIGHAIQGRYSEKGWIFTTSELVLVASTYYFAKEIVKTIREEANQAVNNRSLSAFDAKSILYKGGLSLISLLTLFSVKSWEMMDAWTLPSHYKVVDSSFQLRPMAYYDDDSLGLGLSLKYKF